MFADFDDADVSAYDTFAGGAADIGIGLGLTTGADGAMDSALSVGINPGAGGGFAGFVVPAGDSTADISDANFMSFFFRAASNGNAIGEANLPLTLEINLQEDSDGSGASEGAVDDEFQAVYRVEAGTDYQFVEVPLSAFADDNSVNAGTNDGFDFENLRQVVFALGGIRGPEFAFAIDDIVFTEESQLEAGMAAEFNFFDNVDFTSIDTFSGGAADIGIGVGPTTGSDGTENSGFSVGINPGAGGGFAGFVVPRVDDAAGDISGANALTFRLRPTSNGAPIQEANLPLTLEINLQEDSDGNGAYDGATEDEFQATYQVQTGDAYTDVVIPLSAFADDNSVNVGSNDGFDFENLFQVVFAFGNLQGPEFAFAIDDLGFTTVQRRTSSERLPETFTAAPSVYPNPTAGAATVAFDLAAPSAVAVDVVDLLGRGVATLADGPYAAGAVRLAVPTGDLPAGLYVVRVRTAEGTATTRLTVVR